MKSIKLLAAFIAVLFLPFSARVEHAYSWKISYLHLVRQEGKE